MSFLGSGNADCGPVNPMSGLMKQFGQDRSLQQVRNTLCETQLYSSILLL